MSASNRTITDRILGRNKKNKNANNQSQKALTSADNQSMSGPMYIPNQLVTSQPSRTVRRNLPRSVQVDHKELDTVTGQEIYEFYNNLPDSKLFEIYDAFRYKGFDRELVLKQISIKFKNNMDDAVQIVLSAAIRGPVFTVDEPLSSNKSPADMGIGVSSPGSQDLSISKMVSATADIVAMQMAKLKVPKRINVDLPAWFQFPGAAALHLKKYQNSHREWSIQFSELIGGDFNIDLYNQISQNKYGDENIELICEQLNARGLIRIQQQPANNNQQT